MQLGPESVLDVEKPADSSPGANRVAPESRGTRATLLYVWGLLKSNRRFMIAFVLTWMIVTTVIVFFLLPKEYESTAQLLPSNAAVTSLLARAAQQMNVPGIDLLGQKDNGAVFIAILRSRNVADDLIRRFDLLKQYHKRYMKDARKRLAKNTEIEQDRKSGVLTLTVTDHDPGRAAQMAAAYIEELNRTSIELNTSAAHRERVFLEGRLQQDKQEIDDSMVALSEYSSKNGTMNLQEESRAMMQGAVSLESELIAAQTQLSGLQQIYSDENIQVKAAKARVDELRRQEAIAGEAPNSGTKGSANRLYPSLRQLPVLGVRYADLEREVRVEEGVYQLLTEQYELAKVEEAKELPVCKVLDAPDIPEKKSWPPRTAFSIVSFLASISAGIGWLIFREHQLQLREQTKSS